MWVPVLGSLCTLPHLFLTTVFKIELVIRPSFTDAHLGYGESWLDRVGLLVREPGLGDLNMHSQHHPVVENKEETSGSRYLFLSLLPLLHVVGAGVVPHLALLRLTPGSMLRYYSWWNLEDHMEYWGSK